MSTDPLKAAVERVDAAIGGDLSSQSAAVPPRDLAELAAAIERAEALIAAGAPEGADGSAAVERIADIAFVLHEREVEASLCDALDAAVREISDASAIKQESAQRTQQAAELLRELSRRVSGMIAFSEAEERTEPPEAAEGRGQPATANHDDDEASDDEMPRDGLFDADVQEDDDFAQVVAALAASLPELADLAAPLPDTQPEAADDAAQPPDLVRQEEFPAADAAGMAENKPDLPQSESFVEAVLVVESSSGVFLVEESLQQTAASEQLPDEEATAGPLPAEQIPGEEAGNIASSGGEIFSALPPSEQPPSDEVSNEASASPATPSDIPSSPLATTEESSNEAPSSGGLPPSTDMPSALASPVESPADPDEYAANADRLASPETDEIVPSTVLQTLPPAEPEVGYGGDRVSAPQAEPPANESNSEPAHSAPSEPADFTPEPRAEPVEPAADQSAHYDVARVDDAPLSRDAEQDRAAVAVEAVDRALEEANEAQPHVEVETSRASLPGSEPQLDPEDDPGDLFEPLTDATVTVAAEPANAIAAPAQHLDIASDEKQVRVPSDNVADAANLSELAAPNTSAPALSPSVEPSIKQASLPQSRSAAAPVQNAPRATSNDPLAPVRTLSEEEMIALFS
jgi:hypothetical protein